MSYSIVISTIPCPHCNHHKEVADLNYTSNTSGIWADALKAVTGHEPDWDHAFGALAALAKIEPATRGAACKAAANWIREHHAELLPKLPKNGWGTIGGGYGCEQVLDNMAAAFEKHPDAEMWVGR